MSQALKSPKPAMPRKIVRKDWCSRARDKLPLTSSLTGSGRAGKYGELVGRGGGRYTGEVLAGRPHGFGQYYIPSVQGSTVYTLKYDGEWIQGLRNGQGTEYFPNGEMYSGDFVSNVRHGQGRLAYLNGDVYEGSWDQGRRNGAGQLLYANGDVFVGNFLLDKREGLGTLLRPSQGLKHVSEYLNDEPLSGTVLKLSAPEIFPITSQMRDTLAAIKRNLPRSQADSFVQQQLPAIQVSQPSKVLFREIVNTRHARRMGGPASQMAQKMSGTFGDVQMEMLRHSYVLMCGGDSEKTGLLPSQLRELAVMADLDATDASTEVLVLQLAEQQQNARDRRIHMDDFMRVVAHFKSNAEEADREEDSVFPDSVFPDSDFPSNPHGGLGSGDFDGDDNAGVDSAM